MTDAQILASVVLVIVWFAGVLAVKDGLDAGPGYKAWPYESKLVKLFVCCTWPIWFWNIALYRLCRGRC